MVVTNFCLGKQLLNEDDYLHDQRGSFLSISPDVLSASHQKPYKGKPSDIWALGVVLYTMLYSQFPFFETKPAALFKRIKSVDYKIPKHTKVSEGTQYLIKNMLLLKPEERLTATEIREQIERMISNKRQFFLRIDQMVPEIDVQSRVRGSKPATQTPVALSKAAIPRRGTTQEPLFELSRERLVGDTAVPSPASEVAVGAFSDGVFQFPKRERTGMAVHHLSNDARLLTGDEWGLFSRIIQEHGGTGSPVYPPPSASGVMAAATTTVSSTAATTTTSGANSSTMSSRLAARTNNAMRLRQMYNNVAVARSQRQVLANSPAPLRTSDPLITGAVAAARSARSSPTASQHAVDLRLTDYRVFQSLFPRPPRATVSAASALPSTNSSSSVQGTVSPSSMLTIRLRAQADNFNQMLARIDRILTNRLDDAARDFCTTLADMFSRGQIPSRGEGEQSEFNGVLTTELAEQIGDWLLQDCSETVIVRDIFSESTVNAKEKVVELLRRCGIQVDIGPTIEIKRSQNYESVIVLSYILQATGYNSSYFA